MVTKFGTGDDVGDPYPCAQFYYDPIRVFDPCHPCAAVLQCVQSAWAIFFFGGGEGSSSSLEKSPRRRFFND